VRGVAALREVRAQEGDAHPSMPEARAAFQRAEVLAADDRSLRPPEHHGVRRVVERAEHACHVAQRAALDAPLAQWPRWLAFEVDDDEVVAGAQDLAEVIVAVRADAQPGDATFEHAADALLHFVLARQQRLGITISLRTPAKH